MTSKSRLLPGRYPPPGTDEVADHIRQRRGERGITSLDANLLHFPAGARGYNDLLGALRTGGKLPGDFREALILRIAALNGAAYEWIQHEPIGRREGLTTGQLYTIRDTDTPLPPMKGIFSPLLEAGLDFVDALTSVSTSPFKVDVGLKLKSELRAWAESTGEVVAESRLEEFTDSLYAEASMLVATYNLVSRFLLSTDVEGLADSEVPWPLDRVEHRVSLPSYPDETTRHDIYAVTLRHRSTANEPVSWIVLSNSLLTSTKMWGYVVPYLLDAHPRAYNILLHDQRGHGKSGLPPTPAPEGVGYADNDETRRTTIPLLAWDVQNLLVSDDIRRVIDQPQADSLSPIHAIIGVSQGGACALAFGATYSDSAPHDAGLVRRTKSVIACDTSARTPAGNRDAWKERVNAVIGQSGDDKDKLERGSRLGLPHLADITLPRWFPAGSSLSPSRRDAVRKMVEETSVEGFIEGARALGGYDLVVGGSGSLDIPERPALFDSAIGNVLLLAGSLDGNGKVGDGLEALKASWDASSGSSKVAFARIEGAGHLPMIDRPEEWCCVVGSWLASF